MAPEMAREIPEGAEAHPEMRGAGDEVGENGRKAHASRHRGATGRLLGRRQSGLEISRCIRICDGLTPNTSVTKLPFSHRFSMRFSLWVFFRRPRSPR